MNISVFFPVLKSVLGGGENTIQIFKYTEKIIRLLPFPDPFMGACILLAILLFLKEAIGFSLKILTGYGVGKVVCDVKEDVFKKYITSDYLFYLENKQGDLMYKLIISPTKLGTCLQFVPQLITSIFMTIMIGGLLFSISAQLTLFLLIIGLLFNTVTQLLAKKVSYHLGAERASVSVAANVIANEFIDGFKHIKTFGSFELWNERFKKASRRYKELSIKDTFWVSIPESVMQLVPALILIILALFFKAKGASHDLILSNLALMSVYAYAFYRLIPFLTSFGRLRMQIMGALPDVEIIYNLLDQKTAALKDGDYVLKDFDKEIRFENVSFSYKNKKPILKNINFTMEKGRTTAIVGPSGTGKTTLINLIMRLFDPDEGRVTIDGIDIKTIKYLSLNKVIGLVSQESFIFNASIKDNIMFGLPGVSSDRLAEGSKFAHAHGVIFEFSHASATIEGGKGLKMSGGQRQRIVIARTILHGPKILILDEATSSLDYHSEALVQNAINEVSKSRTVIVIAHRLSTIINADKIIVLNNGEVIEEGTHRELVKNNGIYEGLYRIQERYYVPPNGVYK